MLLRGKRITVTGPVQGVGLRPAIYRLALENGLRGMVCNSGQGVWIDIAGPARSQKRFLSALRQLCPISRTIEIEDRSLPEALGENQGFVIAASDASAIGQLNEIPRDTVPCPDCLKELFDPADRRYLYGFISCATCGPRYSILRQLPFDRQRTSLAAFDLCRACTIEYEDPNDRRFHAQTIGCHSCGPRLNLWLPGGRTVETRDMLPQACEILAEGGVLMLKGLGGYQLLGLASSAAAVKRIRRLKRRPEKPLAMMVTSLNTLSPWLRPSFEEVQAFQSPAGPIVLIPISKETPFPFLSINSGLTSLGVMAPSTPLHWLIAKTMNQPLVVTSANAPAQPMLIHDGLARTFCEEHADGCLVHDRPIEQRVDDSVVMALNGAVCTIRAGRGLAPIHWRRERTLPSIATGAHSKNCTAVATSSTIVVTPHNGDLSSLEQIEASRERLRSTLAMYQLAPPVTIGDFHERYHSHLVDPLDNQLQEKVWHHHAHAWSCLEENNPDEAALVLAWDGSGLGADGSIYGGECFGYTPATALLTPLARPRGWPLLGGEQANKHPWRNALALLVASFDPDIWQRLEPAVWQPPEKICAWQMKALLQTSCQSVMTSSIGRLYDGVAALIGIIQSVSYEGQAAMLLESHTDARPDIAGYPFELDRNQAVTRFDWRPMIAAIVSDLRSQKPVGHIAQRFQQTLCDFVLRLLAEHPYQRVLVTGGVFQNRSLFLALRRNLAQQGIACAGQRLIPPNDGGLAFGQIIAASQSRKERLCV